MTALAIILAVLSLALAATAAYLWTSRAAVIRDIARAGESLAETQRALEHERGKCEELTQRVGAAQSEVAALTERIDSDRRAREQYQQLFEKRLSDQREQFREMFGAEAAKIFDKSADVFLKRAGEHFDGRSKSVGDMVKPIAETLKKTDEKLAQIEKDRAEAFGQIGQALRQVQTGSEQLRKETAGLVNALRKPQVRGRYGEMQLRRVAELAGMRDYCDFSEQTSSRDDDGNLLRPDMIVNLPNDRVIVVDAKTNIEAYLDAAQAATPEDESHHLARFARHVAEQAEKLAGKKYWKDWDGSPEFVVMFIPGDQFIDAALQHRPDLFEQISQRGVILASPSTLIGLLRAVHVGWREKRLGDRAAELFELGRELHDRAATMLGYASRVGASLEGAVKSYNQFVGSAETRMLPTLRKFEEAGAKSSKEIAEVKPVESIPRELTPPTPSERLLSADDRLLAD